MPLCPQITNTAVTVTSTGMTTNSVAPVVYANSSDTASLSTQITTAQNTANGKNTVTYSTSAPSGSGTRTGDIWWQYSGGIVIGQSSWNGSSWVSSPISSAVIANLDAAKITSGIISSIEYNNGSGTFRVTAAGALTASSATITGTITSTSGSIGGFAIGSNYIGNPSGSYGMNSSNGFATFSVIGVSGIINTGNISSVDVTATGVLTVSGLLTTSAGLVNISGGRLQTSGTITAGTSLIATNNVSASGTLTGAGYATVSNTANTYMSAAGLLSRNSASSIRFKENVVDIWDVAELNPRKLLDIKVRAFSYKEEYLHDDDRAGILIPGLIAEEVDAVYPLLADYADGEVENINDRAILVNLLALVQEQEKRIALLEGK